MLSGLPAQYTVWCDHTALPTHWKIDCDAEGEGYQSTDKRRQSSPADLRHRLPSDRSHLSFDHAPHSAATDDATMVEGFPRRGRLAQSLCSFASVACAMAHLGAAQAVQHRSVYPQTSSQCHAADRRQRSDQTYPA